MTNNNETWSGEQSIEYECKYSPSGKHIIQTVGGNICQYCEERVSREQPAVQPSAETARELAEFSLTIAYNEENDKWGIQYKNAIGQTIRFNNRHSADQIRAQVRGMLVDFSKFVTASKDAEITKLRAEVARLTLEKSQLEDGLQNEWRNERESHSRACIEIRRLEAEVERLTAELEQVKQERDSEKSTRAEAQIAGVKLLKRAEAAEAKLARYREALQEIADHGDCDCDHDTLECCANCDPIDYFCPGCVAGKALLEGK